MLVCFWSPKGGSGTSVVTAAAGLLIARNAPACIADLTGDQPAVLGLADEPATGLRDWLRAGPQAPADALDRLVVDVGRNLSLLASGAAGLHDVLPEAGAALGVALAEIADVNLVVVRGCYLALRRAVHHGALELASGAVLVDEHGRSLGARDVEDALGVPVVATIEARTSTARAVDAGVLPTRMPESLARPLRHALVRIGCIDGERAA